MDNENFLVPFLAYREEPLQRSENFKVEDIKL